MDELLHMYLCSAYTITYCDRLLDSMLGSRGPCFTTTATAL